MSFFCHDSSWLLAWFSPWLLVVCDGFLDLVLVETKAFELLIAKGLSLLRLVERSFWGGGGGGGGGISDSVLWACLVTGF
jgi:hypothetical protein